jgi:hypothetical protein
MYICILIYLFLNWAKPNLFFSHLFFQKTVVYFLKYVHKYQEPLKISLEIQIDVCKNIQRIFTNKGQLSWKGIFCVIVWTKKPTNLF